MEVLSWKVPMGRVRLKDLSEPSLDGVGGPDQLLPGKGLGVSRGGAGRRDRCAGRRRPWGRYLPRRRRSGLAAAFMTAWRPALRTFVEDGPDCVRPAPLNGDGVTDDRQGGDEALAAVDADHLRGSRR